MPRAFALTLVCFMALSASSALACACALALSYVAWLRPSSSVALSFAYSLP